MPRPVPGAIREALWRNFGACWCWLAIRPPRWSVAAGVADHSDTFILFGGPVSAPPAGVINFRQRQVWFADPRSAPGAARVPQKISCSYERTTVRRSLFADHPVIVAVSGAGHHPLRETPTVFLATLHTGLPCCLSCIAGTVRGRCCRGRWSDRGCGRSYRARPQPSKLKPRWDVHLSGDDDQLG